VVVFPGIEVAVVWDLAVHKMAANSRGLSVRVLTLTSFTNSEDPLHLRVRAFLRVRESLQWPVEVTVQEDDTR